MPSPKQHKLATKCSILKRKSRFVEAQSAKRARVRRADRSVDLFSSIRTQFDHAVLTKALQLAAALASAQWCHKSTAVHLFDE
jgi:hypothetical protein